MTGELTGLQLRFDAVLDAHLVTCARCGTVALVQRGDRAHLLLELASLGRAGWRKKGRKPLCPPCARSAAPEPRTPRPSVPYDASLARATLRAYAGTATGETRRWALILLREWGGDEIDGLIPTKLAKSTDPP